MHMADALVSATVGGVMWGVSAATIAYSARKVSRELDERKVPLMGVLGAFVFAAQMINFTIPGTGSSGHLGGGLLLAILLGPHGAFLTIASVLVIQALFFADGGLLALGCNIFNLGFFPAFVAYPLIYRLIAPPGAGQGRVTVASIAASVVGLQLGAFSVVLETVASGISSLPFSSFVILMQPIHLAIGIVEGIVTALVVRFVARANSEIVGDVQGNRHGAMGFRGLMFSLLALAFITGGVLSWYASENPDGLEWAVRGVTGREELDPPQGGVHRALASIQERVAFLPDYSLGKPGEQEGSVSDPKSGGETSSDGRLGTSVSGIVGGILTLGALLFIGRMLRRRPSS